MSSERVIELPPLEICPPEMLHGYPGCDCDLEGGDESCTKSPTYAEICERYGKLPQRERQLRAALTELQQAKERETKWHEDFLRMERRLAKAMDGGIDD